MLKVEVAVSQPSIILLCNCVLCILWTFCMIIGLPWSLLLRGYIFPSLATRHHFTTVWFSCSLLLNIEVMQINKQIINKQTNNRGIVKCKRREMVDVHVKLLNTRSPEKLKYLEAPNGSFLTHICITVITEALHRYLLSHDNSFREFSFIDHYIAN